MEGHSSGFPEPNSDRRQSLKSLPGNQLTSGKRSIHRLRMFLVAQILSHSKLLQTPTWPLRNPPAESMLEIDNDLSAWYLQAIVGTEPSSFPRRFRGCGWHRHTLFGKSEGNPTDDLRSGYQCLLLMAFWGPRVPKFF